MKNVVSCIALLAASLAAQAQVIYTWTDITPPTSISRRLSAVAVHPLEGGRLVAGFAAQQWFGPGAIAASNDGGLTWTAEVSAINLQSVESLFAHPGLPGTLFLQEGTRNFTAFNALTLQYPPPSAPGRTLRSDDFGRTWSFSFSPSITLGAVAPFGTDPLDVNHIMAVTRSNYRADHITSSGQFDMSVAISRDGGRTWANAPGLTPGVDTDFSGTATAPTPLPAKRMFFSDAHGVSISNDSGATWSAFHISAPGRLVWAEQDPRREEILYALVEDLGAPAGGPANMFRSDDNGATWHAKFRVPRSITDVYDSRGPTLTIDPVHPRELWLWGLDSGISYSTDGGETWTGGLFPASASPTPYPNPSPDVLDRGVVSDLVLSPAEPRGVYVIWKGRLFRGVPSAEPEVVVSEFQYESNRYWLTSLGAEALFMDYHTEPGNIRRTGESWGAWRADNAPPGAVGSCRFWSRPESGLRTRVLVLQGADCEILKRNSDWILEAENEFFAVPPANGACAGGLVPVHRFHNLKADLNHRWVADVAVAAQMSGRGWFDEGVRFCARPLGSNE